MAQERWGNDADDRYRVDKMLEDAGVEPQFEGTSPSSTVVHTTSLLRCKIAWQVSDPGIRRYPCH